MIFISLPFALFLSFGSQASSPRNLSLGDVLKGVDTAFPKLVSARLEADIANAKLQEKRGAFDPIFSVENDFLRYNSATSPGKLRQTSLTETSVEVLNRSGIKFAFGARYNTGVLKSPASSTGTLGEYFVSAKIPLLRDRLSNAKFVAERQAILGEPLAQQAVREARLSLFEKAGFVYWEWEGAGEKLKIANEILELAVARAAYIRRRVDEGANPAIDIQEADAEVFRRQGSRDKAERDLQKAEFKLQFFQWNAEGVALNLPPSRTLLQPLPNNTTPLEEPIVVSGIAFAEKDRPELLGIKLSRDILALDLELAQNDRRPALDLTLGPGFDLGQDTIGTPFKAGIFYSIPLRQNTADGRITAVNLKLRKLELEENQTRQSVRLEVKDAVSAVNQTTLRVIAAMQEVEATKALERGETIRFREGNSTLFLINQRERGRAEAQVRLVDTRVELEQARVSYLAATTQLAPNFTNPK